MRPAENRENAERPSKSQRRFLVIDIIRVKSDAAVYNYREDRSDMARWRQRLWLPSALVFTAMAPHGIAY